jgi:hypothetical protein
MIRILLATSAAIVIGMLSVAAVDTSSSPKVIEERVETRTSRRKRERS